MGADFINSMASRVRSGDIKVLAEAELSDDRITISLSHEDGSPLTRDERYAVALLAWKGQLHLRHSTKNIYEVRA